MCLVAYLYLRTKDCLKQIGTDNPRQPMAVLHYNGS